MPMNYIKFFRGSPLSYENIAIKNDDTLYFIGEPNSKTGKLYLGDKVISQGDLTINELFDLDIIDPNKNDLLIFDEETSKWVNKDLYSIIEIFGGASEEQDGSVGLVPPPLAGQQNLFLRADGTWAQPSNNSTDAYITNTSSDFSVIDGQLSLNNVAISKVENLEELLNNKVAKKTTVYNGEETEWTLLSPENLNKLNSITIGEGGAPELSGKVNAANVEDLDAWLQQNREIIPSLLSEVEKNKIDQSVFIKSVNTEHLTIDEAGQLSLAFQPIPIKGVSADFIIDEDKILTLSKDYLEKSVYIAEVGDLTQLTHSFENSTIVDELEILKDRLVWQDLN